MVRRRHQAVHILPGPVPDLAEACLETVARQVSAATHQTVVLATPRDSTLTWKSVAIHPLQSLETEYQGIVRDAARGTTNPDLRKTAESNALSQFFAFDAGVPELLGVAPDEPYDGLPIPLVDTQLRTALRLTKAAKRGIDAALATPQPVEAAPVRQALQQSWDLATGLLAHFYGLPGSDQWRLPLLDQARQSLTGQDAAIRTATTWNQLQASQRALTTALAALEEAVSGYASVQMLYFIDSFYLYRLLIRFRLESHLPVGSADTIEVSGALTKIITRQPWLSAWLRDKLVDLRRRLRQLDPAGDVLFFLKGGRAIKYLEGEPERGENDWDTQIVINPDLPPQAWYSLYQRVQNAVLLALQDYRLEFYTLLTHYAPTFATALQPAPPPANPGDPVADAPPDPLAPPEVPHADPDPVVAAMGAAFHAACKSELIDVGLPRYDTIEAREQWVQLKNGIVTAPDGMPYPGYLYYISEYIAMLREVFAGLSPSPHKAVKRIERLYKLLSPTDPQLQQDLETVVAHERALIPPTLLPQSVSAADTQPDPALRRVLTILLQQFSAAYVLQLDPGFAQGFDDFFTLNLANAASLSAPPQALTDAIAATPGWNPAYNGLVTMVGYAQWVSAQMEQHLAARAAFLGQQKQVLGGLMQAIAGVFSFREEWEVELAMTGGFAAQLHADYTRYPHPEALEPPFVLTARLFAQDPKADPATIIELVQPAVQAFVQQNPTQLALAPSPPPGSLQVFWASAVPLGQLTYAPLVLDLAVAERASGWPQLAYIWGLPVLALRDLVKSYQRETAGIEEFGRRQRLRTTTAALTEIYIRANNPEPPNPVLIALGEGRAPYLKLSSSERANGTGGDFPPSYFPARAFELPLTANPAALRRSLVLPPAAGVDRTLELLVLNQGHGDWQQFATWSAADLAQNLVQPLLEAGVRARVIVLDFCLSASLIATFTPLCAPGGQIISSVYSTTEIIMTPPVWARMQAVLDARNQPGIAALLADRLAALAANGTGLAQLPVVRGASWSTIAAHIRQDPNDRDALSIIRVLIPMGGDLRAQAGNLARLHQELAVFKQRPLPWEAVGFNEQAILALLPDSAAQMTEAVYADLRLAVRRRVTQILTDPLYRIGLAADTLQDLPLFDGPNGSLWDLLIEHQTGLLALAHGLEQTPTPFTRFDADSKQLTLDAALLDSPLTPAVAALIGMLEPQAPADVPQMLTLLRTSGAVLSFAGQPHYDQP